MERFLFIFVNTRVFWLLTLFENYCNKFNVRGIPSSDHSWFPQGKFCASFQWFSSTEHEVMVCKYTISFPGIFLHNFPGPFLPKFLTSSLTNWSLFFRAYGFNPAALQLFPLFHFCVRSHDGNPFFPILFSLLASYTAWSRFLLKSTRYCCCEKQFLQVKG